MLSTYTRQLVIFFRSYRLCFVVFFLAWLVYDPLQLFSAKRPQWHRDMRIQFAGIINNYHDTFDSVIFGTSMLENSDAKETSMLLKERFINVSASASDFYERHIMLSRLLKAKPVKSIIYSFDRVYLNQNKGYPDPPVIKGFPIYPTETFNFLYDDNRFNDVLVYLKPLWITCLLKWSSHTNCLGEVTSLDHPNAWQNQIHQRDKFGGLTQWAKFQHDPQIAEDVASIHAAAAKPTAHLPSKKLVQEAFLRAENYTENYFLSLVKEYPSTKFYTIFPPYSRAQYAIWYRSEPIKAMTHQHIIRYLTDATKRFPNLFIFGYEDQYFLDDLTNYKDLEHFHERFNTKFHHDIAAMRILTPDNVTCRN